MLFIAPSLPYNRVKHAASRTLQGSTPTLFLMLLASYSNWNTTKFE